MALMGVALPIALFLFVSIHAIIFPCNCGRQLLQRPLTQCSFTSNASECELYPRKLIKRDVNHIRTELEVFDDGRCNSDKLLRIMKENLYGDYRDAKMRIMKYAEDSIGGHFGVICAPGEFSYVTKTRLFCLYSTADATCFIFLTEHELPIY
uniref:Ground-like domain-containing protein n=1 Tax=Parascaris univalens TaxID=6257 RepID=A0A915BTB7_PARUN